MLLVGCGAQNDGEGAGPSGVIYAYSDKDGTQDVYQLNPATGELSKLSLSTDPYDEMHPLVGPDGKLYYASNEGGDFDIWRANLDGTAKEVFVGGPGDQIEPAWSPDGRYFAYTDGTPGSYLVKVWDTQSDSTWSLGNSGRSNISPWWVDDTLLVCVLQDYAGNYSQEIYLHNARTGETTLLVSDPSNQEGYPRVSPNGDVLAFVKMDLYGGPSYLYLADFPTGSNQRQLAGFDFRRLAWSPDGSLLAAAHITPQGEACVALVDPETGDTTLLAPVSQGTIAPYWWE